MGRKLLERRAEDKWYADHDKKVAELVENISKTVRILIKHQTVSEFAEAIHYSRTTLTALLNQKATDESRRSWTLSTLVAIADALGLKLSEFIAAAETVAEGKTPQISTRVAGTAPHSSERLQKLIYAAVNYDGDVNKQLFDGMLEMLYRVKDIEYAVPDFWSGYISGAISDESASFILNKAAERHFTAGEDAPPFWAALLAEWKESVDAADRNPPAIVAL